MEKADADKDREEQQQQQQEEEDNREAEADDPRYVELPTNMEKKNQQKDDVPSGMPVFKSALEEKLYKIRMKSEEGRKRNRQEVSEEHKRTVALPPGMPTDPSERQMSAREWREREERILKEAEERGEDPEVYRARQRTAEQLDRADKKKKSKTGVFGWEVFSPEAQYYTQKRKVLQLKGTDEEYQKQKAETADFYREADNVNFVNAPKLPAANVDRMVSDLKTSIAKRKEVSRRRAFRDDGVDYINERNRAFNQRIGKAYDAYTAEIKANLERGTAL